MAFLGGQDGRGFGGVRLDVEGGVTGFRMAELRFLTGNIGEAWNSLLDKGAAAFCLAAKASASRDGCSGEQHLSGAGSRRRSRFRCEGAYACATAREKAIGWQGVLVEACLALLGRQLRLQITVACHCSTVLYSMVCCTSTVRAPTYLPTRTVVVHGLARLRPAAVGDANAEADADPDDDAVADSDADNDTDTHTIPIPDAKPCVVLCCVVLCKQNKSTSTSNITATQTRHTVARLATFDPPLLLIHHCRTRFVSSAMPASASRSPSPVAAPPVAAAPGPRASALHKLYSDAIAHTLKACHYKNFASCFPTPAKHAPEAMKDLHHDFINKLDHSCKARNQPPH